MKRFADVTRAVAWRSLHNFLTNPSFFFPAVAFPLFFFVAFAGGLSSVGNVPGFDYAPGYTAFQFVFILLQSAAFGGVFTGFGIAADFERGFTRRLMLGAPNRYGILAGYVIAAIVRAMIIGTLLFAIALITGMPVPGTALDIVGLALLAVLVALAAALFAAGVAMRARTIQAGPAIQMPVFLLVFLAPVYVPLELLAGWVHAVAKVNPFTLLLGTGRDFLAGTDPAALAAYGVVAALIAVFLVWAVRGLRSAEAAGS
jgi:ABC-2 type transport system permease protein